MIKSILFSILYWGLCTALMIYLDNQGVITKHFAWFIGGAMMAIYFRIINQN